MLALVKKIVCCPGVSGREKEISSVIRSEIAPYVDEITSDAMGNLICKRNGTAPDGKRKKIMLCAHMDEIGFIVTFIEKDGLLRIAPIGGIDFAAAAFTQVVFENGVRGVLVPDSGVKPADYAPDKFGIDIGASTASEAGRRVKIGDCCALEQYVRKISTNRVIGRPLDDRVGCAIEIEIASRLAGMKLANDVYFVFSVQEEVGLRGSHTAAYGVAPDEGIVYDVTGTGDTPGCKPMACRLGDGAAVKIKDRSCITDPEMNAKLYKLAAEKKIAVQTEILPYGGTDTASIQLSRGGAAAAALSVPSRYIHSGVEMMDMRDVEAIVALSVEYLLAE